MRKRIFSILLTIAVCLSMMPAGVWAADGETSGQCPHDRFTNSICDICHAACTHDEYTSDDKCARCGAPFAVRVEHTDGVGLTSNKLYMKTTAQDGTDDTLRQVFNEAADGSTITLLANGMLPDGIYASKTLTLDLNGHSLSGYSLNVGGSYGHEPGSHR